MEKSESAQRIKIVEFKSKTSVQFFKLKVRVVKI